jgi:hypothetical protein
VSIDPRAGNELQDKAGGFSLQADLIQDVAGVPAPAFPAPAKPATP